MSSDSLLEKVKKLREITGVGFKDCKAVIDETKGDIEKSIDLLRKKGISKANKRSERPAAEGLISIHEKDNNFSIVEINTETDFVAKNKQFINFAEEVSEKAFHQKGTIKDILITKMNKVILLILYMIAWPTYILTLLTSSLILLIMSPILLFL